jgi:PKD repeat protein
VAAGNQTVRIYGGTAGDHFGNTVATGTFTVAGNTSRALDVLVGAPFAQAAKGQVSMFFASSLTFLAVRDLSLNQDDLRVTGQSLGDELGWGIATGNVDNKKGIDLVVTAPFATAFSRMESGEAYVLLSKTALDNLPPQVSITALPTSGVAPLSVNFTATASDPDGTIAGYAWDFADGGTSTLVSPSHTFTAAGSYNVKVTVTDNAGATAQATVLITVSNTPVITVHIAASVTTGPPPLVVSFTPTVNDPTGTIATYAWDFGDGSNATQQNVSHSYATPGIFTARLTVTDNHGATGMDQGTISVVKPHQPPTVAVTSPNGGEVLTIGSTATVTWTASADTGSTLQSFDVFLSTDGGATFTGIIGLALPGSATSTPWTIPFSLTTMQARVRVIAHDSLGVTAQATSAGNFSVIDPGIAVHLLTPVAPTTLTIGQPANITWQVPGGMQSLIRGFDLLLSTDGGQSFPLSIASNPNGPEFGPSTFQFIWVVPDALCTDRARIMVVATSLGGTRTFDSSTANIAIHDTGPTILDGSIHGKSMTLDAADGPGQVPFLDATTVQISTDTSGTVMLPFDGVKVRAGGFSLTTVGRIAGARLQDFFPDGSIRILRITNPPCAVTVLKVLRQGRTLVILPLSGTPIASSPTSNRLLPDGNCLGQQSLLVSACLPRRTWLIALTASA